ncbi:MAG: dipeptide ABC transporter ATP-binding protein [Deltaproteobacteria bacterium]|nr:dipeptide ABC transporter ATP-binding protein [Deltaproteobacteria bacterium]
MEPGLSHTSGHLLDIENIKKYFPIRKGIIRKTVGWVQAIDGVSLYISKGEALGLVGESGCGKSTLGKCILKLLEPTAGRIFFDGQDIGTMDCAQTKAYRKKVQAIFQDPYSSLNPRMSVAELVGEPLLVHKLYSPAERLGKVENLLNKVGLSADHMPRFPHEFSGGQRQRIGIARALALEPDLIVCDEPVSALDVSVQAQVINLLDDLKAEFDLSYLFIAHDLSVVEHVCDRIAVMYLGKVVEIAKDTQLYTNPLHPYTQALLSAIPQPVPRRQKKRMILTGEVPSPINPPTGCRFHPRCPVRIEVCLHDPPLLRAVNSEHFVACHLVNKGSSLVLSLTT